MQLKTICQNVCREEKKTQLFKTSGNDPSITRRFKYAQLMKSQKEKKTLEKFTVTTDTPPLFTCCKF